ncbi:DUF6415 family natural product biosynthesis protein [Streptomyces sp. NPDC096310]|uniref:DUF6415 family natural product biosynthesis protein n=1 Tax=Streptomyces sp. NPDC096310 TaxID=3366082 RepID=UPI0037F19D53
MTDNRTGGTAENAHTTYTADSMQTPHTSRTPHAQRAVLKHVLDHNAIGLDADRALAPHRMMPPPAEIADLTNRLVGHGATLVSLVEGIPGTEHTVRTKGALKDWYDLTDSGPGAGAMANWVHMRALARMCRTFMDYLRERDREGRYRP